MSLSQTSAYVTVRRKAKIAGADSDRSPESSATAKKARHAFNFTVVTWGAHSLATTRRALVPQFPAG